MIQLFANSGDPDQTPHPVATDLGLHYLPNTLLGVSRLQWVNSLSKPVKKSVLLNVKLSPRDRERKEYD